MKNFGVALVVGLIVVLLAIILLNSLSPGALELREQKNALAREQARELAPLWLTVKRIGLVSLAVILSSAGAVAAVLAVISLATLPDVKRWARIRSWLIKPMREGALYPAVAGPDGAGHITVSRPVNEAGAQKVAALTTGLRPEVKLLGAAARAALRNDPNETVMPDVEVLPTEVPAAQVLADYNPTTKPHWCLIGDSGSGKSSAVYDIVSDLRRRFDAEFLILEKGGNNWNQQAAAITPAGYMAALDLVEAERQRREVLIRAEDCQEADRLQTPPPFLIVVVEEAETVFRDVRALGTAAANRYKDTIRTLSGMGRKQRIILVVATTTGTGEVFDGPTRKNLGNKLIFRSEPVTGDQYSIPREVGLPRLPTGTCYSLTHAALVAWPHTPRPKLPISRLYRERRPEDVALPPGAELLQLAADAESDGLGPDDQPDSPGVILVNPGSAATGSPTVVAAGGGNGQTGGISGCGRATVVAATTPRLPMEERVRRVPRDHVPNREEDQETIYEMWLSLARNSAATQRAIYDYDGGKAYYYCAFAINRALARRGQPPRYKEESK